MEKTKDAFSTYHPVVNFVFYIGAFLFSMMLIHPVFLCCSLGLAIAYYITVKGRSGWKFVLGLLPFFLFLSVVNPIFNTLGDTILFTYWNGRTYTWEALCYGITLAALFTSVVAWFASYNAVMTSDKFLYLFGRWAPSLSLVLTMVLRFVPSYQKHIIQIGNARKCIGKSAGDGSSREKISNGLTIVSALTSWALEGGIVTADSMRCRGFGCGKRSSFSLYRWTRRDGILLVIMLICMGSVLGSVLAGGAKADFVPSLAVTMDRYTVAGIVFYIFFLGIPAAINIGEDITWRILRSKL